MVWDWVMGQLNYGSRGSRVTKCDPLSAPSISATGYKKKTWRLWTAE